MWSFVSAVILFVYHCVCEYLIFLVIDMTFRGPLDRALTNKDMGVLWALEGSILLIITLTIAVISHRPLVIGFMTSLTFLYSLHKYDDSLKELVHLIIRVLRWADTRFFHLRCLLRHQWRRWRTKDSAISLNETTPVTRPGRGLAWPGTYPLASQRTPRLGPSQLFSNSGLASTDPPVRRWAGPATRFASSPIGPLRVEDVPERKTGNWKKAAVSIVKAGGCAIRVVSSFVVQRILTTYQSTDPSPSLRPPRGLKSQSIIPGLNPLLQAIAHCPPLMKALNSLRPSYSCSIDQEALFTSLLPVLNALSTPDVEAEDPEDENLPVNSREVHETVHRVIGCPTSLGDIVENLLLQLHSTCKEIDRVPRVVDFASIPREMQPALQDETSCRELLNSNYRDLMQIISPTSLHNSVSTSVQHRRLICNISSLAFWASKWSSGHSQLRQLVETQVLDLTLCPSCGRLGVNANTQLVVRAPAVGQEGLPRLSLTEAGLCGELRCICGGLRDPATLSPIAIASPRPPGTPGARPTTQTSTPVLTKRCRSDGTCCRRFLKHAPSLLLIQASAAEADDVFVTPEVELGGECRMQGDPWLRYRLRAAVCGRSTYCRVGKRWFHCLDEDVKEWRWGPIRGSERLMFLEKEE